MNTPTTRRLLLAVALSGAVLTGCVPAGTTGTATGGCDPNGFGPFSGCGDTGSSTEQAAEPVSSTDGCDPSGFGPLSGCGDDDPAQDDSGDRAVFIPDADVPDGWMNTAAEHEAGHVVVAEEYGFEVVEVELEPDGDGHTDVMWTCNCPMKRVAVLVAGEVAAGTTEGADADAAAVDEVLATVPPLEQDGVLDAAYAEAERIVAARSAEIDRVAVDLLEDGELS